MTKILENIKTITAPLLMLFALIVLYFVLYSQGFKRIIKFYGQYQTLNKQKETMALKLEELKKLDSTLLSKSDTVVIALPQSNDSSVALSNVRNVFSDSEIIVSKINLNSNEAEEKESAKEKLSYSIIDLELSLTDFEDLLISLDRIYSSLPLIIVNSAELTKSNIDIKGKISLSNYWSQIPTVIPDIKEPIVKLSESEIKFLNEISTFETFQSSEFETTRDDGRVNPFQI